jgi:predicted acetyltransferase
MTSTSVPRRKVGGLKHGLEVVKTSLPTPSPAPAWQTSFDGFNIVEGRVGDHHAIQQLLTTLFHGASVGDFQAQIDDPFYEPNDRMLIKRDRNVVGHVHLTKRDIHFGPFQFPTTRVTDLGILPEYRGRECATQLLAAAERRMEDDGALMGVVRTGIPGFFTRRGWSVCMRHSFSVAGTREILSRLGESAPVESDPLKPVRAPLNIRLWRHVEQAALMRIYADNTHNVFGPVFRNDSYWRWLINRRAYDRIYIAINGPDKIELNDTLTPIVGYAVIKGERILELMTSSELPRVAEQLLARTCRDAIEHDTHHVQYDAAPNDPLHEAFKAAGGRQYYHEVEAGQVWMVKVFDPIALFRSISSEVYRRAKAAGMTIPSELGVLLDGKKYALSIRQRTVRLEKGKLGRSYLECSAGEFTQLMLGHLNVEASVEAGRLQASTRVATETASILFPQLPLWHPPFDSLPS